MGKLQSKHEKWRGESSACRLGILSYDTGQYHFLPNKKRGIEKKRGLTQDYSSAQKVGNQQETIQMRKSRLYGQRQVRDYIRNDFLLFVSMFLLNQHSCGIRKVGKEVLQFGKERKRKNIDN